MGNWQDREPATRNWIASVYRSVWRRNVMRSGMVTVLLIGCVLLGLTIAFRAHMQGNFHRLKLKANIDKERAEAPVPRPGGQEAIVLLRSQMTGDTTPQFLSATLLPGRGMNVLQITAFIPGRGEVKLLASPDSTGAEAAMTGKGADAGGQASLAVGSPFEVPWAGELGSPTANGPGAEWHEEPLPTIATKAGAANSESKGGLLLSAGADAADSGALPDGGTAHAVFHAGSFGGRWSSKTDVTVNVLLSSRTIELTVIAANVGDVAEPIGIGWSPRFAVGDGDRSGMRLHLPADHRIEFRNGTKRQPAGKSVAATGGVGGFSDAGGASLNAGGVDEYFTGLQQKLLDDGPSAELMNRTGGYSLRLTAMSPKIRAMHVFAPAQGDFISIDPQYNLPDPFGKEWDSDSDSGMVMLEPGQSTEWKVRLELRGLDAGGR